jgi:hypothetical protein
VFPDSLLLQLLALCCGQAAACVQLRTGRFWRGAVTTVMLWAAADLALVAGLLWGAEGGWLSMALWVLQATAIWAVADLGYAWWRRKQSAGLRASRFAAALQQYLANDLNAAAAGLRVLVRSDPWDTAAWLLLGNVHRRRGDEARMRRCYRTAAAVDRQQGYVGLLRQQQALPMGTAAGGVAAITPAVVPAAALAVAPAKVAGSARRASS